MQGIRTLIISLILLGATATGVCIGCITKDKDRCSGGNPDPACTLVCGQCPGDKPICNGSTGTCEGCTTNEQCLAMNPALPACDTSGGQCVQCTAETEATICAGKSCNLQTHQCTTTDVGSVAVCGQCITDSECITDMGVLRCVATNFKGAVNGTQCLRDLASYRQALNDPSALCPPRFTVAKIATSLGGSETEYCFPDENFATCEAIIDFKNPCPTGNNEQCGKDAVDDGLCRTNQCTYECTGDRDCPGAVMNSCTGGGPSYCNPN